MVVPVLIAEAIGGPGNGIQPIAINLLPTVGTLPETAVFYPLQRFADFDEDIPVITVFLKPTFLHLGRGYLVCAVLDLFST